MIVVHGVVHVLLNHVLTYSLNRKAKFKLFNNYNGSLLSRQPGVHIPWGLPHLQVLRWHAF